MARVLDGISAELRAFLEAQPVFFVATAPTSDDGHINCSPKGLDTFRVLDEHTVAYLDLTGSGIETVAHVPETARITLMFCAFDGRPDIIRLYGRPRGLARRGRPAGPLPRVPRDALGHRGRRRARLELVQLRGPEDDARRAARRAPRLGHEEGCARAGGLLGREERAEHRRIAGPAVIPDPRRLERARARMTELGV